MSWSLAFEYSNTRCTRTRGLIREIVHQVVKEPEAKFAEIDAWAGNGTRFIGQTSSRGEIPRQVHGEHPQAHRRRSVGRMW